MINTSPFFILANPRSGSSLLRIICESHSQLSVPPESGFMEWWYKKYKNWKHEDSLNPERVELFVADIMKSKKIETWYLDPKALVESIHNETPNTYAQLIALIYISFAIKGGKNLKFWGDKNNYYIHKTSLLDELYPNAKYIHLIRDGRDVATSYIALKDLKSESSYKPKLTYNIEEIAKEWNDNNIALKAFLDNIEKQRVIRIYFEDIIKNLKEECIKITNFLGVPFEEKMLEYYVQNKEKLMEPIETLDWKKKTLEKPDIQVVGKYTALLSEKEVSTFNDIAGQALQYFNYE